MRTSTPKTALFRPFYRFLARWRYPTSMPEDIARALGVPLSNDLSFPLFLQGLSAPSLQITRLKKFMPRLQAEKMFHSAIQKERFKQSSLFSYSFQEGWLEFQLIFDEESRLRRIYLEHKNLSQNLELKLPLI